VKERFGDAIHDVVNISNEALKMKVPPLAIQMLIENAVKHNSFNNDHPLQLVIQSSNSCIEVTNSLRERSIDNSHSLGLYNLNQRYKYLSSREVIIKKTDKTFEVKIPLLQ
jgi:LytS/YehU family sensor histidine kinase